MSELLNRFDHLLQDIQPKMFASQSKELVTYFRNQIHGECEKYKTEVLNAMGRLDCREKCNDFLLNERKKVILLKNRIYFAAPELAQSCVRQQALCCAGCLFQELNETELFLRRVGHHDPEPDEVISELDAFLFRASLEKELEALQNRGEVYLQEPLLKVILGPLEKTIRFEGAPLLRSKYEYLRSYTKELKKVEFTVNETDVFRELKHLAFRCRLNSPAAFQHFTERVLEKVFATGSLTERVDILIKERKKVSTIRDVFPYSYEPGAESLKDSMYEWIDHELAQTEKQIELNKELEQIPNRKKLRVRMSVSSIAFMMRLLKERQILYEDSLSELATWVSTNVSSKRAESISAESLRTKSYEIPERSRERIAQELEQLLDEVRNLN